MIVGISHEMGEIWMYFEMQSPTNEKNFIMQLELGVYGGQCCLPSSFWVKLSGLDGQQFH